MNPRQRRGALLMILAAIGSVAVFISVLGFVNSVNEKVGNLQPALQLTKPVKAYTPVQQNMLRRVEVPQKWMPDTIITNLNEVNGMVAATDLPAGAYLQQGMFTKAPDLQPGQREIAIMIDAETGVAGKVQPGSTVDILATFPGDTTEGQPPCAVRVVSRADVIDVGNLRQQQEPGATEPTQVVPVTFALSQSETKDLTFAESFGETVRLSLLGPADNAPDIGNPRLCEIPEG